MVDIVTQAASYVERGWSVVPLRSGQSIPIENDWPRLARRTVADVATAWAAYPGANVGIATGYASGLWVLDIDPRHGGDSALAGLVQAYGRLPETYAVGTPHGGVHYYFSLPDFEPSNSVGRGKPGRLPEGIDVRGRAGQVVAPPSIHHVCGKSGCDGRPYGVLLDVAVAAAPEWLIEMIRPAEAPAPADPGPQLSMPAAGPGLVMSRGQAYAQRALNELHAELASASPGTRNATAFAVACRLIELSNSPWSGLPVDQAFSWYISAASRANIDGTFSEQEARSCWISALHRIGARGVELPPADFYGAVVQPPPDFGPPVASHAEATPATGDDPTETAILAEVSRLWIREEAQVRLRGLRASREPIEVLSEEEADARPLPEPLVDRFLYRGHVVRLFGPPGGGKTFAAVDWAACVANGRPWHGHRVQPARAVYVAAEDPAGVSLRLRAWRMYQRLERHGVLVVPQAIQLDRHGGAALMTALEPVKPGLVVLDTQAMVTGDMDEDRASEMREFIVAVKAIARRWDTAVLIVHHSGVAGGRGRGSTAMDGAMDFEYEASIAGSTVTLRHKKAKNTPRNEPIIFSLNAVTMPERDAFDQPVTSCVLMANGDPGTMGEIVAGGVRIVAPRTAEQGAERFCLTLISVLRAQFSLGVGGTKAEIKAAFGAHPEVAPLATKWRAEQFNRAWGKLVSLGRVGRNATRDAYKFVELSGVEDLAANPDKLDDHGFAFLPSS